MPSAPHTFDRRRVRLAANDNERIVVMRGQPDADDREDPAPVGGAR
jgi:hypothetical protein